MTTICYFSATGGPLPLVSKIAEDLKANDPTITVIARGADQLATDEAIRSFAEQCALADVTVLSLHGGLSGFSAWSTYLELAEDRNQRGEGQNWLHIQPTNGDDDAVLAAMEYGSGVEDHTWHQVNALFNQGGLENLRHGLCALIDRARGQTTPIPEPIHMAAQGIYHPDLGLYTNLPDYLNARGHTDELLIGIMYPQTYWVEHNNAIEHALVRAIERHGAIAVPVFCSRWANASYGGLAFADVLASCCQVNGERTLDAMIDVYGMSMVMIDPALDGIFKTLDLPILHALTSYGPVEQWAATSQGLGALDVSLQAAGPEFDGEIIASFIGTRETDAIDPITGAMQPRRVPIPDRIEAMAKQALAWARLKRTPNADKRVAIIFHHHPPRADKIGCASGLDTFESIRRLLQAMRQADYEVGDPFPYGDAIADELLAGLTCDQRFLDDEQMHARARLRADLATSRPWFDALPARNQQDLERNWGPHPGELFVYQDDLSFAGFVRGNVCITVQPPRGSFEAMDDGRMHDETLPPPHHYLAQYRYIRDVFKAHAVIHVGTHGTLEWLPGKGLGLSEECYPELALSDMPNIYPYIINNPGEGTQAKRRSAAVIVDHLTPPMRNAGLYDELAQVDQIIREYAQASAVDIDRARTVAEKLWEAVVAAGLDVDLGLSEADASTDPTGLVNKVNHHLMHLAERAITDGLHVLGSVVADGGTTTPDGQPDPDVVRQRLAAYLTQLVRIPNGEIPSLPEAIIEYWGTTLDAAHNHGTTAILEDGRTGRQVIEDANAIAETLMGAVLDWWATRPTNPEEIKTDACDLTKQILGCFDPQVCTVVHAVMTDILWRLDATTDEIDAILEALDSRFVLAGPSGAPTRGNAQILPTGRNFYSIDPRTMPTPAAWEEGKTLANQLLERHAEAHPDDPYPNNIGLVVWGSANMRTGGTDIAEILYLYGVQPVWGANGHVTGLDVIPLSELGRPRIDATPRVSGFFRDAFPNLVEWIDMAARMVAALSEPEDQNRLRAHVLEDVPVLQARGLSLEDAQRKATLRVFGCQPGSYGVGIEELIETGHWETKADLAKEFIASSAYGYGDGVFGEFDDELYHRRLATMDVVTKNEDSREYDMLSCTDFYNEFGGLIAAATVIRGVAPESYVGDMADPRRIQTRSTLDEARLIIRSRMLNPAWIDGLQRHGYKGAGDLSKVLDILIGWDALADVVDDQLWSQVAQRYALDPAMQAFLNEHNPHALFNIANKLLDAAQRGIWDADQAEIDRLTNLHDEIEGSIEELMDEEPGPPPTPGEVEATASLLDGLDLRSLGLGHG